MPELIINQSSGFVLIESEVVHTLNSWQQHGRKLESGGILIGYRRPPHMHVTACTTPFPKDIRSRFCFYRRDNQHRQIAHQHWKDTEGQAYYLGDWHTHPTAVPSPSTLDLKEWSKLMESSVGPQLLFIIVGTSKWYVQLKDQSLGVYSV